MILDETVLIFFFIIQTRMTTDHKNHEILIYQLITNFGHANKYHAEFLLFNQSCFIRSISEFISN